MVCAAVCGDRWSRSQESASRTSAGQAEGMAERGLVFIVPQREPSSSCADSQNHTGPRWNINLHLKQTDISLSPPPPPPPQVLHLWLSLTPVFSYLPPPSFHSFPLLHFDPFITAIPSFPPTLNLCVSVMIGLFGCVSKLICLWNGSPRFSLPQGLGDLNGILVHKWQQCAMREEISHICRLTDIQFWQL